MKKLLVLMLVLGMASLANAAYTISFSGGNVVVGNDEPMIGGINVAIAEKGSAPLGAFVLRTTGAPTTAPTYFEYGATDLAGTGYDAMKQIVWGDAVTQPNPAGEWFTMAMPGYILGTEANHTVQLDLANGNAEAIGGTLYLLPEPTTLAILGLGGLLLRRKK
jgi:hypothetical protein